MNRFYAALILQLLTIVVMGQSDSTNATVLLVGCNKTTSLVFPQVIKSIDRGSRDLFAQKVNGAENVLQLKAARENFSETNMTVITADGKLYGFTVCYAASPRQLTIRMDSAGSIYDKVARQKRSIHGIKDEAYEMVLRLKGLFIQSEILYVQLELENLSNISYGIDMLRFYTADKKQSRRTAIQELEQVPLYVYHSPENVPGRSGQVIVAAFTQFTIPDKKLLYVQVTEKNGGRNLRLTISNNKIVKARVL